MRVCICVVTRCSHSMSSCIYRLVSVSLLLFRLWMYETFYVCLFHSLSQSLSCSPWDELKLDIQIILVTLYAVLSFLFHFIFKKVFFYCWCFVSYDTRFHLLFLFIAIFCCINLHFVNVYATMCELHCEVIHTFTVWVWFHSIRQ